MAIGSQLGCRKADRNRQVANPFSRFNTPLRFNTLVDLLAKPSFSHLSVATPVGCCELGRYPRKGEEWGTATSLVPKSRRPMTCLCKFCLKHQFPGGWWVYTTRANYNQLILGFTNFPQTVSITTFTQLTTVIFGTCWIPKTHSFQ